MSELAQVWIVFLGIVHVLLLATIADILRRIEKDQPK